MTTALPCPFCGSEKVTPVCSGSQWYVLCHGCGATGPGIDDGVKNDDSVAVEQWNKPPRATARELLATGLIDRWVEINKRPIPWDTAVKITAIITGMPDAERDRLLALG